jgi:hypothetical protein
VYVSETADQPIVLTLTQAELHDTERPSARIDGLKPMFFYAIQVRMKLMAFLGQHFKHIKNLQVAAFNPGGIGPRSERIPVRIGARDQPNADLVRHSVNGGGGDTISHHKMSSTALLILAFTLFLAPPFPFIPIFTHFQHIPNVLTQY